MMKDRIEKLGAYTRAVTQVYQVVLLKLAMLEPLMYDDSIVQRFREGPKAFGRNSLISTLYLDCTLAVVSLAFDKFEKAASIKNVIQHLLDERFRAELRSRFANGHLSDWDFSESLGPEQAAALMKELHERERKEREELFDQEYGKVTQLFDELEKSDASQRLRTLRDKVVAHNEIVFNAGTRRLVDVKDLGILVGDLGKLVRDMEPVVLGLELIVNLAGYMMGGFKNQTFDLGLKFWQEEEPVRSFDDDPDVI